MGARTRLGRLGLTGCWCLTVVYLLVGGHSNAGETRKQPRHSLVIRPAASSNIPASLPPPRHPEKSKSLSLVIPIQLSREDTKLTSPMPPVAESAAARFSNMEDGQGR